MRRTHRHRPRRSATHLVPNAGLGAEDFLGFVRQSDRRRVAALAAEVASLVLAAGVDLPPSLEHWAQLASDSAGSPYAAGDGLTRRVRELTVQEDTGGALDWLAAGEGLAPVLGGDLGSAVARGKRRVDLESSAA